MPQQSQGRDLGGLAWKDTREQLSSLATSCMLMPRITVSWQRDNEFILTGYRRASFSYGRSIWSMLAIHNETANIWSHFLGALWFITSLHINAPSSPNSRPQDILAIALYQLCVSACFTLSTFYHTFSDHSPGLHKLGNELDHLGIVLVMWGTGISGAHFAFNCHHQAQQRNIYFALLTLTGLGCAVYTLRSKFRRPEYRTARFLVYCLLGASLFAPVAHGLLRSGFDELQSMMGLGSFLALALINFAGAAVYAARIPERWYPRTFDLLGQSHNWMHVLVLAGALVRLRGLYDTMGVWQVSAERYRLCGDFVQDRPS